jgi:hypothetical protein
MRAILFIAGAALALSACSRGGPSENNQAAAESLTPENIVSNDVTAIDAVTGDAANMAADVDMNFGDLNQVGGSGTGTESGQTARRAPQGPAPEASNTTANITANTTAATTNGQ